MQFRIWKQICYVIWHVPLLELTESSLPVTYTFQSTEQQHNNHAVYLLVVLTCTLSISFPFTVHSIKRDLNYMAHSAQLCTAVVWMFMNQFLSNLIMLLAIITSIRINSLVPFSFLVCIYLPFDWTVWCYFLQRWPLRSQWLKVAKLFVLLSYIVEMTTLKSCSSMANVNQAVALLVCINIINRWSYLIVRVCPASHVA